MVWGKGERVRVKGLFLAPFPLPLFPLTDKYWDGHYLNFVSTLQKLLQK
ncbi:hypothetical protein FDUTEX481_07107 [Tolypothrix sp. PCC 7601]|nr:hypothetical protein FDUTEX481_07107 [Tolypothrix sp. PCC 7601]